MTLVKPSDIDLNEIFTPGALDQFLGAIVRDHPEFATLSRKRMERNVREVIAELANDGYIKRVPREPQPWD
jgi:hypothetical protein